ncbi:DUF885 domain-containing protein [Pseudonocardia xinjiangensis]|uniref:DUF885 domain-containing protein n=1 Tax=Pseudonocardia xinjiangensis TaxID=75289 RepID=A0ABX1RKY0_9PSEU|nr:DUF885 domain-containing protein [Pseudonocardia xinjiangensis]NMH79745.1 DUF885 domain-containing protein [Pseudonocardia xinjiangensis]
MTTVTDAGTPTGVRALADDYVRRLADLDTRTATSLGTHPGDDRTPDLSPDGQQAIDDLARSVLAALPAAVVADDDDRRCARLLRERLEAQLAVSDAGEHLRTLRNIFGPHQQVRQLFELMPTATSDDWDVVARRMARVPQAYAGYVATLTEGSRRGLYAAPRQVETVVGQLDAWLAGAEGTWFHTFVAKAPEDTALRAALADAADDAAAAALGLRDHLAHEYLPAAQGTPDGVGAERYRLGARLSTGSDLDLAEAYAWGWDEFRRLDAEMHREAQTVLPGADPITAMRHLDENGDAVDGVEEVRIWLQKMMDTAIDELDGAHFDISGPIRTVEAMIAPSGSAAAPYYTRPSLDFSRPGRTWLPTLGQTRFPLWGLVSTWYHEGVPGHHLQLARWAHLADRLSTYQTTVGSVSGNTEGWALYAERLMDELGYLTLPGTRLGYLDAQQMRAIRVVIDIGMHLGLQVPADSSVHAGETWTPEVARAFFGAHCGRPGPFLDSEIVRYLGWPGQAISYKLGERAWLAGRDAARAARGADFDPKAWHGSALSLGSLGLDDLTDELARL